MTQEPPVHHPLPWFVLTLLAVAAVAAIAAFGASVINYRQLEVASQADVEANRDLIANVRTLQEASAREMQAHRDRNEALHECIVSYLRAIARAADDDQPLAGDLPGCLPDQGASR